MMTKEEVRKYLAPKEPIMVRGPKGALRSPWKGGTDREEVMNAVSEAVVELLESENFTYITALEISKGLLGNYKRENAALKKEVKDLKANIELFRTRGLPCAFCNATGSNQNDGKKCGHCDGTGIV